MKSKFIILFIFVFVLLTKGYTQKFAIVGDQRGATTATQQVSELINSFEPEFILTTGDNFDLTQGTIDYQVGQFYYNYIFPYTGSYGTGDTANRFFPSLGNHELNADGLTEYLNYFTLAGNERYYDFVKGNVHFFIINSNTIEPDGSDSLSIQAQWLKNNLLASTEIWNIVCFHHSPYSSSTHGNNSWMNWAFQEWGATAVFAGHDHVYERIIKNDFPYFINGAGGASLYTFNNPVEGSVVRYNLKHGAQLINASTDSISFKFYSVDSELIDSYTIFSSINYSKHIDNQLVYFFKDFDSQYIKYYINKTANVLIEIYAINGLLTKTYSFSNQLSGEYSKKIPSGLKAGVYIISFKINNSLVYSKKIIF